MKITTIKTDTLEILDSGIVICYPKESITLSLIENDGTPINIKFIFNYNKEIINANINLTSLDKDTLLFTINHSGSFVNFGFVSPQSIGHYNNHELFLNFRIDSNGIDDSPSLKYTWYLKK